MVAVAGWEPDPRSIECRALAVLNRLTVPGAGGVEPTYRAPSPAEAPSGWFVGREARANRNVASTSVS